ncbi:MAG: 2-succinyl-5-enolpyruvyl-6-hydroxy-3-cyclohexene-1-carboxylic-acid synthase, partial [Muribaculaceae bacterium]|nr:2-succinyl-5-enolpyruvyl-6-hydroxy-3-cyclohexene-1-carboxylic-acid synthase [Muribaculaceae bacterium]
MDTTKDTVRILFDVLEAHGVRDVVCSPGSRNAPLLIAAEAREKLTKHVVVDERSAAFVALGIAVVSQCPVALVCTSGTAVLNYAPAVAEAYYQGIPLIVISADRPLEWIDQDDSQTIRQPESLANFVKGSYSLSDRVQGDRPGWYETRITNDAMLTALAPKQGPVHINVRLSPPLGQLKEHGDKDNVRVIHRILPSETPDKMLMRKLGEKLINKRVMVVAGFMNPDSRMTKAMLRMRSHPNVVVMAETISNIHLPAEDYALDTVLCTISDAAERIAMAPDVVISCGGALVSRMLKEYLRECALRNPDMEHWCVGYSHTTTDCFQALTLRIDADPAKFMAALTASMAHVSRKSGIEQTTADSLFSWASLWKNKKFAAIRRMRRIAEESPWSDMSAYRILLDRIPDKSNLFLSNGTSIRYAQILTSHLPHAEYCNRGVSGIDGSTSTAIGGAL